VREFGFRGFTFIPMGMPAAEPRLLFPYYAKAQELKVPAIVSMGHTLDLMPNEPGRPMHLDTVALYFPDLAIVCTHTGLALDGGSDRPGLEAPNVFLGTSAHAPKYWKPELAKFIDSRGQDKCCGERLPPHRPQGIAEPDRSAGP